MDPVESLVPLGDLELPLYLPIQQSIHSDFERMTRFPQNVANQVQETIQRLTKLSDAHVNYMLEQLRTDVAEYLDQIIAAITELTVAEADLNQYTIVLNQSRDIIRAKMAHDPELSLAEIPELCKIQELNFGDYMSEQYIKLCASHATPKSDLCRYLEAVKFVIQNPQDPIPEDTVGEDDINVSGGKISLKDPISLDYYKNPVICSLCNHSFEKEFILAHINSGNNDCPVAGCNSQVKKEELLPDKIMQFRVKLYLVSQRSRRVHVDRVV